MSDRYRPARLRLERGLPISYTYYILSTQAACVPILYIYIHTNTHIHIHLLSYKHIDSPGTL